MNYTRTHNDTVTRVDGEHRYVTYIRGSNPYTGWSLEAWSDETWGGPTSATQYVQTADNSFFDIWLDVQAADTVSKADNLQVSFNRGIQHADIAAHQDNLQIDQTFGRIEAEVKVAQDNAQRTVTFVRKKGDSALTWESLAEIIGIEKAHSDSVSTSDNLTYVYNCQRSEAEVKIAQDAARRVVAFQRSKNDQVSKVDNVFIYFFTEVRHSDFVGLSETFNLLVWIDVQGADIVQAQDNVVTQIAYQRIKQEILSHSENSVKNAIYSRNSADFVTTLETFVFSIETSYSNFDFVQLSEQFSKSIDYFRRKNDYVRTSERISFNVLTEHEFVTTIDHLSMNIHMHRDYVSTVDTLSFYHLIDRILWEFPAITIDNSIRAVDYQRFNGDIVTWEMTHDFPYNFDKHKKCYETLSHSEAYGLVCIYERVHADNLQLIETFQFLFYTHRETADTIGTADAIIESSGYHKISHESVTYNDLAYRSASNSLSHNDFVRVSETFNSVATFARNKAENIQANLTTIKYAIYERNQQDTISETDGFSLTNWIGRTHYDFVEAPWSWADLTVVVDYQRYKNDTVVLQEGFARAATIIFSESEVVRTQETFAFELARHFAYTHDDNVTCNLITALNLGWGRVHNELLGYKEAHILNNSYERYQDDTSQVVEGTEKQVAFERIENEIVGVFEGFLIEKYIAVYCAEEVYACDNWWTYWTFQRRHTDSVTFFETVVKRVEFSRVENEIVSFNLLEAKNAAYHKICREEKELIEAVSTVVEYERRESELVRALDRFWIEAPVENDDWVTTEDMAVIEFAAYRFEQEIVSIYLDTQKEYDAYRWRNEFVTPEDAIGAPYIYSRRHADTVFVEDALLLRLGLRISGAAWRDNNSGLITLIAGVFGSENYVAPPVGVTFSATLRDKGNRNLGTLRLNGTNSERNLWQVNWYQPLDLGFSVQIAWFGARYQGSTVITVGEDTPAIPISENINFRY